MRWLCAAATLLVVVSRCVAQERGEGKPAPWDWTLDRAPTSDEAPAPALSAEVLARVARAVVILERIDSDGRALGPASAFIDSRGFVVTNRHCVRGAAVMKLNLGPAGLFDLSTLAADGEDLDVALLKGQFPEDAVGRLEWAKSTPAKHSAVSVVVRDPSGRVTASPGWSGDLVYSRDGMLALATSAPAWQGCSGTPLVDKEGRVVGVVNRLGTPVAGQFRTTAEAALTEDVLKLSTDKAIPLTTWSEADNGPQAKRFYGFAQAAEYSDNPGRMVEYARAALAERSNDVRATILLVRGLDGLGRNDEATEAMKQLAAAHPEDRRLGVVQGHRLFRSRKFGEAVAAYQKSIDVGPTAVAWYWMGAAQAWQHDYVKAAECYEQAVRLEPRDSGSWDALAWTYGRMGQAKKVAQLLQLRSTGNPEDPELLASLAKWQWRAGEKEAYEATLARLKGLNSFLANRATIPAADSGEAPMPK